MSRDGRPTIGLLAQFYGGENPLLTGDITTYSTKEKHHFEAEIDQSYLSETMESFERLLRTNASDARNLRPWPECLRLEQVY